MSFVSAKAHYNEATGDFTVCDLLHKIIGDISRPFSAEFCSLPKGYEQITDKKELADILRDLAKKVAEFQKPPLLLIDDYDAIPEEIRYWLEGNVFSSLARIGMPCILTSVQEVRFRETLDLRMRVECHQLKAMSVGAIVDLAELAAYQRFENIIYRVTGGLPGLIVKFLKYLKPALLQKHQDPCDIEYDLMKQWYRSDDFEEEVFADWNQEIKQTLLTLSLLRRFDVKVLGELLPQIEIIADFYREYNTLRYLERIDDLRSWIQWRMQGGYALDEAFRVMLHEYVKVEQDDLYQELNEKIVQLYRSWLKQEYRETYFVELLYHRLCLLRSTEERGLCTVVNQEFRDRVAKELLSDFNGEIAERISKSDSDRLDKLLDQDPDLKFYVEEIRCALTAFIRKDDSEPVCD